MISKEGVILEVVEKHPGMEDVFRNYNDIAGKCTMCHNLFDWIYVNTLDKNLGFLLISATIDNPNINAQWFLPQGEELKAS